MSWFTKLFTPVSKPTESKAPLFFTNTLSEKKELFVPIRPGQATFYSCGPTVYSRAHIGNLRSYVFSDLIARVLASSGYRVRRVINITDVGHMVSDADDGEDKMEMGAKREGMRASDLAARNTRLFIDDLAALHIDTNSITFPRATEYIKEQIAIIKLLEEKGYAYSTHDGVYFDTEKFAGYGKLGNIDRITSREEATASVGRRIKENMEKRHASDFALWRLSPHGEKRQQEWNSPWGTGFPGWHIECSAMTRALLGQPLDIHTGGIDHIPVHHNNEIAQSEAAYGVPLARFWIHNAFLSIEGDKVSKSLGNDIYLSDIEARGLHPLSLRYLFLQAQYRSPLSFSWEALEAANEALHRLWRLAGEVAEDSRGVARPSDLSRKMIALLRDDLSTPAALALLWEVLKDEELEPSERFAVLECAEQVLGLSLLVPPSGQTALQARDIPPDIQKLIKERDVARVQKDYARADELRNQLSKRGYHVDDGPSGAIVTRQVD